ncbi:DUF2778 domain-containing protein [Dyadobacter sp. CY107]|uniref:tlde1 domain-containing protein n=1 Tax=Dyadobacter fanqingshengii TaxID=2906443 RepID=UPI001F18EE0F|nr:tlde1 domain-containing protein [Dyadobacter fanqingshengii]MCF2502732.1 DUF2778 domain-containing protein [Dyadobacter fanqingshengii]
MRFSPTTGRFHIRSYSLNDDSVKFDPNSLALVQTLSDIRLELNSPSYIQLRTEAIDTLESNSLPCLIPAFSKRNNSISFYFFSFLIVLALDCFSQGKSSYCQATFRYYGGVGEFIIGEDPLAISLGKASAGYSIFSNDETFTSLEDLGALPKGQYTISEYTGTKYKKIPNVFDVIPNSGTDTMGRSDFKIHGIGKTDERVKSAAESSTGCIILNGDQRSILKKYFDECGKKIILTVKHN